MKIPLNDLWVIVTTGVGPNTSMPDYAYTTEDEAKADAAEIDAVIAQTLLGKNTRMRNVVMRYDDAMQDVRTEIRIEGEEEGRSQERNSRDG